MAISIVRVVYIFSISIVICEMHIDINVKNDLHQGRLCSTEER